MHKLMHKGLKKKKKGKKGKKGVEEEEFNPEELERYRKQRAEALEKTANQFDGETSGSEGGSGGGGGATAAGSDEWKKFQALTAGVDSILKKTQGDLDRIKSTSFFQRKAPVVEEKKPDEDLELEKIKTKRWIGYDKDGNPIEATQDSKQQLAECKKDIKVSESGFVEIDDEEDDDNSEEEDIFDTTYIDVLENTDIKLAYIPDSPTEELTGDDPFDTTNADKVLKTVDKHGNKVVSLGNAVEVLSGRVDYVSTCKISRPRKVEKVQDLLLGDEIELYDTQATDTTVHNSDETQPEKTLLDDDSDLPDIPIDLTNLPPIIPPKPASDQTDQVDKPADGPLDISEFETFEKKTILEEIPDLDDDFDLDGPVDEVVKLEEAEDPFAEKEPEEINNQTEIIEASFEAATFVDEEDPFDTAFAENLVPGKTELKFIERELDELPESEVSISLTDPAGLNRDYETGLLKPSDTTGADLLGGSATDLSQLADVPIAPVDEITYVDPFDTSGIQEPIPGQTELKFLEEELLGEKSKPIDNLDDDDFDPRSGETKIQSVAKVPPARPELPVINQPNFQVTFEPDESEAVAASRNRKPSRPEALGLGAAKSVAFELPTPSQRPDLLITSDEEKSIASKPLTPYYSQKSLEESFSEAGEEADDVEVDPFDTSFVGKATPGKTELKLIESELLKQETKLTHSISDHDFNLREGGPTTVARRQSDFGTTCVRPKSLKFRGESLLEDVEGIEKNIFEVNEEAHRKKIEPKRQESILDSEIIVDAKPLTPRIETKVPEQNQLDELSYSDPFDTSIASNILPGKAELKLLESELSQIPVEILKPVTLDNFELNNLSSSIANTQIDNDDDDDFNPRAEESSYIRQDFLSLNDQGPEDKVLTPEYGNQDLTDTIDPFDTSFAAIGPGRVELKLLESELMDK